MRFVRAIGLATFSFVLLCACAEDDDTPERFLSSAPPMALLRTEPWVEDFKLGIAPAKVAGVIRTKVEFAPGEAICLSMAVNAAPRGTVVTAYWYGPNEESLGYESKDLAAAKERLRFLESDTQNWREGAYRAEVWIGDYKLGERRFRIAADDSGDAP